METCPLEVWLKANNCSPADLFRKSGVAASQISTFIRGKRGLRRPALEALAAATDGAITAEQLLCWRFCQLPSKAKKRRRQGARA